MKNLFILFLCLQPLVMNSQSTCDLTAKYDEFIKIRWASWAGENYLLQKIEEVNGSSCISRFINGNTEYFDYLLTNFSDHSNYARLETFKDSIKLQKAFIADLQKDTLFNPVMKEYMWKVITRTGNRDTVSMDKLLDIAVKFFMIQGINESGNYQVKICTGINLLSNTERKRLPLVEAFCFQVIMKNLEGGTNLMNEFMNAVTEIFKVNMGVNANEALLRAQGGIFIIMKNNENLKRVLKEEYQARRQLLPFVLQN